MLDSMEIEYSHPRRISPLANAVLRESYVEEKPN
jgi:hypothetical protein